MTSATSTERTFRPEVQGLRAVAVGLVVLYHFWPQRLTGGFVGVDVFFVISGFLITSHLMREATRHGAISLRDFWARRIRRLLPASLLVLAVCAVAAYVWVFPTQWASTARALIASALYVQNWALAADSVDYLALGTAPTIAQHFWSLSVEEQFYVLWPLLLVAGLGLARRFRPGVAPVRTAAIVIGVVGLASFVVSVVMTSREPAWAYFATPARIWELALGAGLALVPVHLGSRPRVVLGWAGIAAIVGSAVVLDGETAFPGWIAAVPTLGAAAVIAAGRTGARTGADRWLSLPPARFLGDVSYAVYLWHWPVVVIAPLALARQLGWAEKILAIVLVVLVSWATKVWVEDRFRRPRAATAEPRPASTRRTFVLAAAGMAVVLALGLGLRLQLDARVAAAAEAAAAQSEECLGPGALADPEACGGVMGSGMLVSPPEAVALQNEEPPGSHCQQNGHRSAVLTCTAGSTDADAPLVVVVGDSHATQWLPAFDRLGQENGFRVESFTKSSCPPTAAERVVDAEDGPADAESCRAWLAEVATRVADAQPDLVVVTAYSSVYAYQAPDDDLLGEPSDVMEDAAVDGYALLWQGWVDQGIQVAAIAAVPRTQGEVVPDCLAGHPRDYAACATLRTESVPPDPLVAAAERTGVTVADLTDQFCDETTCYPVVGSMIVYRDYSHLSLEYARALAPYLGTALDGLLPPG